jgi:beta-glucosidase
MYYLNPRHMNSKLLVLLLMAAIAFSCNKPASSGSGDEAAMNRKIDSLIGAMTLEEKVGQLTQFTSDWGTTGPFMRPEFESDIRTGRAGSLLNAFTAAYTARLQKIAVEESRLGIPLILGYDVIHGFRTITPIPLGESASWDLEAIEKSARVAAEEASASGIHWTFAPMVDIARDPRWGRMSEGAGEDTYLGSAIAVARVRGFQGDDLSANNTILACVKHFAAYGAAQAGRDYHTVDLSQRTLNDVYMPAYKAAVDAGAATAMSSFNEINGVPATGDRDLLTGLLREKWGFKGFVVSDYGSIAEMVPHGFAADTQHAALLSANAGLDMDMMSGAYNKWLPGLVKEGKVKEADIDVMVRRILEMKWKLGLFEDPYRYCDTVREKAVVLSAANKEAARDMARKSFVLLKNDNNVLPLSKSVRTIAVVGPLADSKEDMLGNWSAAGRAEECVSLLEGITAAVPSAKILHARGCEITNTETKDIAAAVAAARQADVVVAAVGEKGWMSGEAASRTTLDLPGGQRALLEALVKTGKPIVLVLMNGRALTLTWEHQNVPAILETWFAGTMGGHAITDVLFGDYNPSGKLPVTFPRSVGQVPIFYNYKNTGRPRNDTKYTSKYLDESNDPLYPFGYGLSYTTFSYSNLAVSAPAITLTEKLTVSVEVKNTGSRAGEEVVQLYVRDLVGSVTRPVRELKGFRKIKLEPGASEKVTFTLAPADLAFTQGDMQFAPEAGKFEVYIGDQKAGFELK